MAKLNKINAKTPQKVRLTLEKNGNISISAIEITKNISEFTCIISKKTTNSNNKFLYHKTTANNRKFYDQERQQLEKKHPINEVIFTNEKGELTEGSFTNIFIEQKENPNKLFTPPIKCGLLNGTLRQSLISQGKAQEKTIFPNDLRTAKKVFLGNSIRGLVHAKIIW